MAWDKRAAAMELREVAEALLAHGHLRVAPMVEFSPAKLVVTLDIPTDGLDSLALFHELQYFEGLCSVRAFATIWGIDGEALEKLLPVSVPTKLEDK